MSNLSPRSQYVAIMALFLVIVSVSTAAAQELEIRPLRPLGQVVYRQQIGNTGEIVFYSSAQYQITNRTSTNLKYKFTIIPKNGARRSESLLYVGRNSSSTLIDCVDVRTGGIRGVDFHHVGPRN